MVSEAKRIYESSEVQEFFIIIHNGLKAWWAKRGAGVIALTWISRLSIVLFEIYLLILIK